MVVGGQVGIITGQRVHHGTQDCHGMGITGIASKKMEHAGMDSGLFLQAV